MQALIKDLHADNKGRAVMLVVVDCSAEEMRRRLASSPTCVDLVTRTHLADMRQQRAKAQPQQPPEPVPAMLQPQSGTVTEAEQQKGGALCKWLAAREREVPFRQFLSVKKGGNITTPELAEQCVKDLLRFTSRIQLDNNPELGMRFRNEIMLEYAAWLNGR